MKNGITAACAIALLLGTAAAQAQSAAGATDPRPAPAIGNGGNAPGADANASSAASPNERAPAVKLSSSDQEFFAKAAASGLGEVNAGQMAQAQGSTDQVKTFGRQMMRDHGKANAELKQLAASKGVTLPDAPDADHQKELDQLKQKQGGEFDQEYAKGQVKDHKEAVSLFEKAAKSKDADIKAFAQKTLPVLKEHLTMAKSLDDQLQKRK
ncbi:MAG TPA: DUF4142 domain-containing protein [Nevskia sp.]|nr:DUF4142 domain-containing protein [Nevskia sp.]